MKELDSGIALSCAGCGVSLQSERQEEAGYLPESALKREPVICQRCFRIRNYNEASSVAVDQDDFLRLLGSIGETDSLVVHIVDLYDFEGSLISGLQRFVGNNPVLLVVNKVDLLPKSMNLNRIRNWVQQQAKAEGLRTVDIVLCSAKRNIGFDHVIEALERHRKGRDVYVVGATNVGKSTLINRLIRDYSDLERELTTSRYPGTTLDAVHIPLDDDKDIIDTPGIVYASRMTEIVPRSFLQSLLPDKSIKPLVYQLNDKQTLFISSLVRFDFVEGERQSFTLYISNALNVHRTKLERADELYKEHRGELLGAPSREELDEMPAWTRHSLRIPRGAKKDIFIAGLGWIQANGTTGAIVDLYAPKGIKVLMRDSLI
ncbi:ribosome biogenesis GTPase YqeH [Paenibacillus radicis (ex Gao et al. 2016)]|uniref:Ribosome biogenesis GTPase YqeH n=1 Tax=Paenibacillus radicis (ex Gao et al. 2016) TaxID=1737354 RepID=A0A917M9N4_9BACL|nr:ribosome biogenesis GTPase YqeH [Paenibacillus radicis (ex Gao et al. 2016)]GGG86531.1 ribosome biogenesis GTPase YqeH [Paenibacillus radicis (ex Gao et al. 2016)]